MEKTGPNLNDTTHAVQADQVAPRVQRSLYPPEFAVRVAGREKRVLGDLFALTNFGVNLTRLAPGASSALLHKHAKQDEFIYILEGNPTLQTEEGEQVLQAGMCAGFKAGVSSAHCLINRTEDDVVFLEVGDRSVGDSVEYPNDDLQAHFEHATWRFTHKDGQAY